MGNALLVVCMLATSASADRLQLVDGRVVEGRITGGDAASYYIETPLGYFSIARSQVVAITPEGGSPKARRAASIGVAAGTYLLTTSIAFARMKEDDDAGYALVPVVGPILWTAKNDGDDFLEDGWDWLALGSATIQAAGLLGAFSGTRTRDHALVQITPTGRGLSVAGSF